MKKIISPKNYRSSLFPKYFCVIFSLLLLSCFFFDTKKENVMKEKLLTRAEEAVRNENFIEAFDLYNLLISLDAASKEANFQLEKLYERFREYNRAINLVSKYKHLVPKDTNFDSILGELYYKAALYDKAIPYFGNGKISSLKKAISLEKTYQLAEAESMYILLAPSFEIISGFLSKRISYCQAAKGVPESVVDLFDRLGKTIKDKTEKYIIATELLHNFTENENFDEALRLISLMKKEYPKKDNILNLKKANLLFSMEQEEKAFELYHTILSKGGSSGYRAGIKLLDAQKLLSGEYFTFAVLCYSMGDFRTARDLLKDYVEKSKNKYAHYLLGMSYYKLGQNKYAVIEFKKLKDSYPEKKQTILYYLGKAEEKTGDYVSAMKSYTDAAKNKKSKYADNAIYLSGLLKEDEGEFDAALEIYKKIKKEFKQGDYLYKTMLRGAILSYRKNDYSLSEEFLTRALQISRKGRSDHVSALYWLGRIEHEKGNIEKRDSIWSQIKVRTPLGYFAFLLGNDKITTDENDTKKWLSTWTDTVINLSEQDKIHWQRGITFLDIGLVKQAEKSFSKMQIKPFTAYRLAELFKEKGFDYESILYSLKVKANSPGSYFSRAPLEFLRIEYPLLYLPTIISESKKYNIEPDIMAAIIHQESAYQRNAVSVANAIGLTQLLPSVAEEVAADHKIDYHGPDDLKNKPELSIQLGTAHFAKLQNKFKNYEFSLAAYNAGERKAKEWKRKWGNDYPTYFDMITYSETRGYVKRVLAKRKIYNILWNLESLDESLKATVTTSAN